MWNMLFVWIWLSYLDGNEGSASVGISLCIDTCASTPKFDALKEMNTFVCHFNRKREQKKGIYKKHSSRSQVTGIECLITTRHVGPSCVFAQCRAVSNKIKLLPGGRSPGQYNTVVSNTKYSCTRRNLLHLSQCIKRKGAGIKEKDKTRTTEERNTMRKKIAKKHTSTKVTGYKAIQAGRDRILVKQYHINKTWDQAFQQCDADGGHLIKLDTTHKLRAIRSLKIYASHWIGMKDLYDNDTFLWIDGAPLRLTGWCRRQPSHWSQAGQKENCVESRWSVLQRIAWNDRTCSDSLPFLCQK